MGCEGCLPQARGYTVYFAENEDTTKLTSYFSDFSDQSWKLINNRMIWLKESILFDLIDYLDAHMNSQQIYAVLSSIQDPLKNLMDMRAIHSFKKELQASWIDTLIERSSICTHYQPIVRIEEGKLKVIGQELLSRGIDDSGSIIPPFKMFEAARVRNRVFALDRACRLQSVKNAGVVGEQMIFINFIPTAIYVPEHCLSSTFKLIKEMGIKPEQVVFEVVETDEVKDLEHLKTILHYYRSHGFKYALDDVGTGFNNLSILELLQPDIVKLAIEYTNGVSQDPKKQEVAQSVLKIAHRMSALALAEGVETKEDMLFLKQMGYDLFQGYYISKPQPQPLLSVDMSLSRI
jgi:EAL domain-containing protein (putative c-di-GMP-specific phosphodiesterase class I)